MVQIYKDSEKETIILISHGFINVKSLQYIKKV